MKNKNYLLIIIISLFFLKACTTFTPALNVDSKINDKNGYIYGNFLQTNDAGVGKLRIGIVFENQKTKKLYTVQFEELEKDSVKVFSVSPGYYKIIKVVYATWDYMSAGEDSFLDHPISKPFEVEAQKAYYIGDYFAETFATTSYGSVKQSWKLKSLRNNYSETTKKLHTKYTELNGLENVQATFLNYR